MDNPRRGPTGLAAACLAGVLVCAPLAHAQDAAPAVAAEPSATEPAPSSAPAPASASPAKPGRVTKAVVRPRTAFLYGMKQISFRLTIAAKGATDIRLDIVRAKSGALERTLIQNNVAPNTPVTIPWDGLSNSGNFVQGKFRFVVRNAAGRPVPLAKRLIATRAAKGKKKKKKKPKLQFGQFDHIFPVRGKHTYGDGIGAPRGDHTHQGQDVSAACGTNLAAAQGGTVQVNAFQAGGAGYYLVIDTVGSDIDHVYMHLASPPLLAVGQAVLTGQIIGQVGNTGSSSGCHLHYEMWSGPGWYEGGAFMDPSSYLRRWDKNT